MSTFLKMQFRVSYYCIRRQIFIFLVFPIIRFSLFSFLVFTVHYMPEYGFSLIHIFQDKYRPVDSVLIRENMSPRKTVFWHTYKMIPTVNTYGLLHFYTTSSKPNKNLSDTHLMYFSEKNNYSLWLSFRNK